MSIKKLSKHMTNLIAAGEVVERPASVVKELVENAMDAGATQISVEIKNGGISLIRVSDNGEGIPADELETAFLRYATSKISEKEDLFAISSMGFRGEALAATAAVSRVELLSKTPAAQIGAKIVLEGGAVLEKTEAGCPTGTAITVRDLFFNTPARHKFLKKDSTEAGYVQSVCQRAAMARPDISFKLIKDGEILLHTPGDGRLYSVIYCIFGRSLASGLLEVSHTNGNTGTYGYVSGPASVRGSRSMQHFLVNGRPVKNLMLQAALEEAFRGRLMAGKFPAAFLSVTLPPELVDVNVHPAKTEVKFALEKSVFDAVYYGVKEALSKDGGPGEIKLAPEGAKLPEPDEKTAPPAPPARTQMPLAYGILSGNAYPPPRSGAAGFRDSEVFRREDFGGGETKTAGENAAIYKINTNLANDCGIISQRAGAKPEDFHDTEPSDLPVAEPEAGEAPEIIGELFGLYILAQQGRNLLIFDKHAAHERIKYEELRAGGGALSPQTLLEPVTAELDPEEKSVILENLPELEGVGFVIEDFGGRGVIVRAVPDIYVGEEMGAALSEMAERLSKGGAATGGKRDGLLAMMACKSAIKSGDRNDIRELKALVDIIWADQTLRHCPHGRPIIAVLTEKELLRQFRRVV